MKVPILNVKFPINNIFSICFLRKIVFGSAALFLFSNAGSQRIYKPNSALSSGTWYKVAVKQTGIYKIDLPFLSRLGINTSNLSSNSFRLFGNGGAMLPEANADTRYDDLEENAIWVEDGGDGILNGLDYILFFAEGPDKWLKDSVNRRFIHHKNLYSDRSFYFLSIGGTGKRISSLQNNFTPNFLIRSFNDRYFHEQDTVNFLSSGKEWYGEEFTDAPGKSLTHDFSVSIPNIQIGQPVTIISNCIARSIGNASHFDISINGQIVQQLTIPAIGGGQFDAFAQQTQQATNATNTENKFIARYVFSPGSFNSQGWLNWFELFSRRDLSIDETGQLLFRDWNSVGNHSGEFVIGNALSGIQVWEVTDPLQPVNLYGNIQNNEFHFVNDCSRLREYVCFNQNNFLTPIDPGKVQNQDLHNLSPSEYIIVTYPDFLSQAQRLAEFHQQHNHLRTIVVTTQQVFNEFGSGIPDPVAIRDFVKMMYDKSAGNIQDQPKYLLLFGDASFDYKDRISNNTNFVTSYQSKTSLDPLNTYTSDDFFGFLDDNEDINSGLVINKLDIGIGRIPAKNQEEAKNYVDKVEAYYAKESLGAWRNNLLFIADDEDFNLHLQDAEVVTSTAASLDSNVTIDKVYMDAYVQESGSGGSRYPQVNVIINNQVYNGTLIWNYNGHGGARRLAEEVVLDQDIINHFNNANKLPLFITATCDFAPYDNPEMNSIGENILLRPKTGAIALMTTTRIVFAFSNRIMNNNYLQFALQAGTDGKFKTLGESVKQAKNYTYQTSGDIVNNRKFTLLGDPALKPGFPELKIKTTKINGNDVSTLTDTLKSTDKIVIEGAVTDIQGNLLSGFNGSVYPVVFDKIKTVATLANDATSQQVGFQTQTDILFRGKASVSNGKFSFMFKMPKDINYQYGKGKLSLYAEDGSQDATGSFTGFIIGGTGDNANSDREGPSIKVFLNDEKFVSGGITNETPLLIVKLNDSSGINTVGTGIGHDLVAILDNDSKKYFVLNDFYESDLNSYQQGVIRFQLPELEPGYHKISIKVWDVMNNSNEFSIEFTVIRNEELILAHVLNYPNPFTTKTQFWFEHNKPRQDLRVKVQIFTLTGKIIKTLKQTINSEGNRSNDVQWNGKDEYGDRVGRGVYLYRLTVIDAVNKKAETIGKLMIL